MATLYKFNGDCNVFEDLLTNICVLSEIKYVNLKVINIITKINLSKTLVKHISCDCKCKFDSLACNLSQKGNNHKCQCERKKCRTCKNDCSWNNSKCICEYSKYLKIVADASVIICK